MDAIDKREILEMIVENVQKQVQEGKLIYEFVEMDARTMTFKRMYDMGKAGWKYCFSTMDIHLKNTTDPKMIFQRAVLGERGETPKDEIPDVEDIL